MIPVKEYPTFSKRVMNNKDEKYGWLLIVLETADHMFGWKNITDISVVGEHGPILTNYICRLTSAIKDAVFETVAERHAQRDCIQLSILYAVVGQLYYQRGIEINFKCLSGRVSSKQMFGENPDLCKITWKADGHLYDIDTLKYKMWSIYWKKYSDMMSNLNLLRERCSETNLNEQLEKLLTIHSKSAGYNEYSQVDNVNHVIDKFNQILN